MSNRFTIEWAAQVRNELLDARVQLDHLPSPERSEHYREVINRAIRSLRQSDLRANVPQCLQALNELFPSWEADGNSWPTDEEPSTKNTPLTADQLADQLLKVTPNLSDDEKERLSRKLQSLLPQTKPGMQGKGLPGISVIREKFALNPGEELDPEMVQLLLVAIASILEEIQNIAANAWKGLNPAAEQVVNGLMTEGQPQTSKNLGRYISTGWKRNLKTLKNILDSQADRGRRLTVSFDQLGENLDRVVNSDSSDAETIVKLLKDIVELQFPNPSMITAMLQGGILEGPIIFARESYRLFNTRQIERNAKANNANADGRDFWKRYLAIAGSITEASLADSVRATVISGTEGDPLCPDVIKRSNA